MSQIKGFQTVKPLKRFYKDLDDHIFVAVKMLFDVKC